jgi:pyocin large subunit-like protein
MSFNKIKKNLSILVGIIAVGIMLIGYMSGNDSGASQDTAAESARETAAESARETAAQPESKVLQEEPEPNRDENYHWGNPHTLQDHFDRHGADFGAKSPSEYAKMAHDFYNARDAYLVKTDEQGVKRIFDPETNMFGSYNRNGSTKTFYKASGQAYFDRQPGELEK